MKCSEARLQFHEFVDGLLPEEQIVTVREHLESCPGCGAEEGHVRDLLRRLGGLPKEIEPPPHAWERIRAAIGVESAAETPKEDALEISDAFLSRLAEAIALRHIDRSGELLAGVIPAIDRLDPGQKNVARLLSYFAQWIDMGFFHISVEGLVLAHIEHLKRCLSRLPRTARAYLSIQTAALLRFCEGCVALLEETLDKAIADLQIVIALEEEIGDSDIVGVANWLLARAHIGKGEYDRALSYVNRAEELARNADRFELLAVTQTREAWLLFQGGEHESASKVFEKARPVLAAVGDHKNLGFIAASLGRIAKREGRYAAALDYFADAFKEYGHGKQSAHEPNPDQARSLVSMAFVEYLMSRKEAEPGRSKLRRAALEHLNQAAAGYSHYGHQTGTGRIHLTRAFLDIQVKELASAESEVGQAYELGSRSKDAILVARAAVLRCKIELLKAKDVHDDRPSSYHLGKALDASGEAIQYASTTQNRRLLAKAYIWRGLALVDDNSLDDARECYEEAAKILQPRGGDNVRDHFDLLGRKLGIVGPRTQVAPPELIQVTSKSAQRDPYDL